MRDSFQACSRWISDHYHPLPQHVSPAPANILILYTILAHQGAAINIVLYRYWNRIWMINAQCSLSILQSVALCVKEAHHTFNPYVCYICWGVNLIDAWYKINSALKSPWKSLNLVLTKEWEPCFKYRVRLPTQTRAGCSSVLLFRSSLFYTLSNGILLIIPWSVWILDSDWLAGML